MVSFQTSYLDFTLNSIFYLLFLYAFSILKKCILLCFVKCFHFIELCWFPPGCQVALYISMHKILFHGFLNQNLFFILSIDTIFHLYFVLLCFENTNVFIDYYRKILIIYISFAFITYLFLIVLSFLYTQFHLKLSFIASF